MRTFPGRPLKAPMIRNVLLLLGALVLGGSGVSAQESPGPSSGSIAISGISPDRFNPSHGTVFFEISGAYFSADPRDVAIYINDRQLPLADVLVSPRIVAASYVMDPGANTVSIRAWDAAGATLNSEVRVWAGNLDITATLTDVLDQPLDDGTVVATLEGEPNVMATTAVRDGSAVISNLPDARIILEASHPSGLSARETVSVAQRRAQLVLR